MPKIGFPIPSKCDEQRRAILPPDLAGMSGLDNLVVQTGYGSVVGYDDRAYRECGCIVADRASVCACPVICNPKPMLQDEYFEQNKTLFGWIHAVQGRAITDVLVQKRMTAIAWEEMYENGRHTFWRNNELSGEAAIAHAFLHWGNAPYQKRVAVVGRGNVARGAMRALERAGCNVTVYDRNTSPVLRHELRQYDVLVNAVMWDVFRTDHLVYEEDLSKMKSGSLIIDISCDEKMGIESSRATTLKEPVYWHKGIMHYAVDHTPTLYFRTATEAISKQVAPFVPWLVQGGGNATLQRATIVRKGEVLDQRIIRFQAR